MSRPIETIEGIGPVNADKLKKAGVTTVEQLLDKGATPKGRKDVAAAAGLGEALVLKWVNMADLMRISGVGEEYSELLEAAGVDTVKELKHRVPENLTAKMAEVNETRKLVRQVPSADMVKKWVEQAKSLQAMVSY